MQSKRTQETTRKVLKVFKRNRKETKVVPVTYDEGASSPVKTYPSVAEEKGLSRAQELNRLCEGNNVRLMFNDAGYLAHKSAIEKAISMLVNSTACSVENQATVAIAKEHAEEVATALIKLKDANVPATNEMRLAIVNVVFEKAAAARTAQEQSEQAAKSKAAKMKMFDQQHKERDTVHATVAAAQKRNRTL